MGQVCLLVIPVHTGVTQLGISERDQLPCVGRVSEDLLVPSHAGVEDHLTHNGAAMPEGFSGENGAVGQHEMSLT